MVNACGHNIKVQDNIEIKYLTNNDYLRYLGLELNTIQIAIQVENHNKIKTHTYDAVSECCNWDEIYDECIIETNNDRIK
jgi:hypothetical protein